MLLRIWPRIFGFRFLLFFSIKGEKRGGGLNLRFDQVWSVRYIIITVYTLIRVGNEGSLEMDLRDGGSKNRGGGYNCIPWRFNFDLDYFGIFC